MTLFFIGLVIGGLYGIIAMTIYAYTNDSRSGKNEDNDYTKERDKK